MIRQRSTTSRGLWGTRMVSGGLSLLLGDGLDRELAAGAPPGWSWPLEARARYITAAVPRRRLALGWERLLLVARRPSSCPTIRPPLCRDRILAAEPGILEMSRALSHAGIEAAAGVAAASLLLRDGAGPLYNRHSTTDLDDAVRQIVTLARR
jgi:hypothetical protein